jgi:hypothetical protein
MQSSKGCNSFVAKYRSIIGRQVFSVKFYGLRSVKDIGETCENGSVLMAAGC